MTRFLKTTLIMAFVTGCLITSSCKNESSESHEHEKGETTEHRGEHERDNDGGGEGEESGTELSLGDTYDEVRHGVHLVLKYEKGSNSFAGVMENMTNETLENVRVEVHLSNGKELGPTTPKELVWGERRTVTLQAESKDFKKWSTHVEVGNDEHGERGEHGSEENGEEHNEGGEHN